MAEPCEEGMVGTEANVQRAHRQGARAGAHVLVGVCDADQTPGAIRWASAEAGRLRLPLRVVSAHESLSDLAPGEFGAVDYPSAERTAAAVEAFLDPFRGEAEIRPVDVVRGAPVPVLLEHVDEATAMLVVGRRGLNAVERALLGSTSIGVARRAPVPVVVVPDDWDQAGHRGEPIVVGASLNRDQAALEFGFTRASALGVPLIAVHAWEIPPLEAWSPDDIATFRRQAAADLDSVLVPWRRRYPTVEVVPRAVAETPSSAVLDASRVAQLAVVGRHSGALRRGGPRLGATARVVLHRAGTPIAVMPASDSR